MGEGVTNGVLVRNTQYSGVDEGSCFRSRLCILHIIGKLLVKRKYRMTAGLTQEGLAERAGMHHNFIGEVERGNMECSLGSNWEELSRELVQMLKAEMG